MPQVFAEPGRLWLLLAVLVAAVLVALGRRRRHAAWLALGLPGLPPPDGAWAWCFAAVGLVLALAGPRWGRVPGSELPPGHDVVCLVDVSRSMAAQDAHPDRLGLAREAATSLIAQLKREPGDRAAVIAFAGRAATRCPLTDNLDAALDALLDLRPGSIEPGGTDLGSGLVAALDAFDHAEHAEGRSIVVLSDGEDHAESWPAAVGRLVAAGVAVHVVAVGDADKPAPVPTPGGATATEPPPMTRRVDAALEQVARATGGAVVPLGVATGDLGALFRDRLEPSARARRPAPRFSERAERFGVFLSAALVTSLVGTWPSARRLRKARYAAYARPRRAWGRVVVAVAIAALLAIVALAADPDPASSRAEAHVARGVAAYDAGRFDDALADFQAAVAERPGHPLGHFDAGAALFALGRYGDALGRYGAARPLAGPDLQAKVDFALGNTEARLGRLPEAIRRYDDCLASTARGEGSAAVRRDAAINRAYLLARAAPPLDAPRPDEDNEGPGPGRKKAGAGRPKRPSRRDGGPDGPGPGEPDGASESRAGDGPSGPRGAGGAGGGGAAPPEADPPEGRLDAALRRIRAAREDRPESPPPPVNATGRGLDKDW